VVQPLLTQRSEVRVDDAAADKRAKKLLHWHNIAVAAAQQCGRSVLPLVLPPMALKTWLRLLQPPSNRPAATSVGSSWPTASQLDACAVAGHPFEWSAALLPASPAPPLFAQGAVSAPAANVSTEHPVHPAWRGANVILRALHPSRPRLSLVCDTTTVSGTNVDMHVNSPPTATQFASVRAVFDRHSPTLWSTASSPVIQLLIGPEGGLTATELTQAHAAAFASVALGPRILRYDTAAVATIAALQSHLGQL
jgi:16S rRNA U1498 N3-methylase RsmE